VYQGIDRQNRGKYRLRFRLVQVHYRVSFLFHDNQATMIIGQEHREKLHIAPLAKVWKKLSFGDPQHLDVVQLIKHAIGLLNPDNRKEKKKDKEAVLVYLFWEPLDRATLHPLFAEHRRNIEKFQSRIEQFIEFIPLSYPEFWKLYVNDGLLKEHFFNVKERYWFNV
jgi:hypothetical protein